MLRIPELTEMRVFKGDNEEPFETRLVSSDKQAMYYIQCYDNEEIYGEISVDGKAYIVGADHVEAAF